MTPQQQCDVYEGRIDFREGRGWVKPDGTGKSMGDMVFLTAIRTATHAKMKLKKLKKEATCKQEPATN